MNILQINYSEQKGGAGVVAFGIKNKLKELGINSSMITADNGVSKFRKLLSFVLGTDNVFKTDYILNSEEFKKADIVHYHNLHGRYFNLSTLLKMSLLKPVVWTLHDQWAITSHCAHSFDSKVDVDGFYACPSKEELKDLLFGNDDKEYIYKRESLKLFFNNEKKLIKQKKDIYSKAKLNIAVPSKWLKNRVEQSVLKDSNIDLIYNGVDTKLFRGMDKIKSKGKLNLPVDKKIIMFSTSDGKGSFYKGWEYVKKVAEHYKDDKNILFLCVGEQERDGSYKDNDSNIKYISNLSSEEMVGYYSACDVFLLTSIAENFPLVILEAMSCGLPIVSFDVGGVKEVVTSKENGYLVNYRDEDDLLVGIKYILELDEESLNKMSELNTQKIKDNFSLEIMIEKYVKLYKRLLDK